MRSQHPGGALKRTSSQPRALSGPPRRHYPQTSGSILRHTRVVSGCWDKCERRPQLPTSAPKSQDARPAAQGTKSTGWDLPNFAPFPQPAGTSV